MVSCKITPINVGSGDSILVQVHCVHSEECYLIDGGPKEYFSNIERCLEEYDLIKRRVAGKPILECNIIVTHPDRDHVNGITELMKKYYITGKIIITEAFNKKLSSDRNIFLQEFCSQLISTHSSQSAAARKPFSPTGIVRCQSPKEKCLCYAPRTTRDVSEPGQMCYVPHAHSTICDVSESGPSHPTDTGSDREQVWNKSSIITTVCKPHSTGYAAVLTGDSFGDIMLCTLNLYCNHTQIFQVPHHGSKKNIQVGKEGTLDMCTDFYSKFTADVYVISGTDKIHPHAEVLSGILKAVYQNSECDSEASARKIVLTGSRGLSAEKIIRSRHMPTGRDYQTFLQKKLRIVHIDDIGIFCEHKQVPRPFITITLVQRSEDCKVLGGVPWTPETYYMEKREIACPCRKYCADVFGWTTTFNHDTPKVDRFYRMHLPKKVSFHEESRQSTDDDPEVDRFYGLHLLEVPFHEEPWQGTGNDRGQQYVYIVAATLRFANYRQVLYLKEIKSAHSKLYEMFAYSDLCWTRKYVPRIFKLSVRSTEDCSIAIHHHDPQLDAYIDQLYST